MPRIGTAIREVYHRPGGGALPAHLEDHYGIRVNGTARLAEGVFRVDHDAGYREHIELTAAELGRAEGVLWIRILWLSAWQCWLTCVSARVHQGFCPRREYVTALAATVRAGA